MCVLIIFPWQILKNKYNTAQFSWIVNSKHARTSLSRYTQEQVWYKKLIVLYAGIPECNMPELRMYYAFVYNTIIFDSSNTHGQMNYMFDELQSIGVNGNNAHGPNYVVSIFFFSITLVMNQCVIFLCWPKLNTVASCSAMKPQGQWIYTWYVWLY